MTHALTLQDINVKAPSVFANNPAPRLSSRYAFVPTANVVEALMSEGWAPVFANESRTRLDDRRGFQKHMLRFRRTEDVAMVQSLITHRNHNVDRSKPLAEFPEVVLTNSHDGSSCYQIHAGIFRLVCCNGLIVADASFGSIRVRHTGDPNEIIAASYQVMEDTPRIMGLIGEMKQVTLNADQRMAFALGAAALRYDFDKVEDCPINYARLLTPRRMEDDNPSLWNTFNTVQENLMKGGQRARLGESHATETGRIVRPSRTRAIKSVDATMKVNKGLWAMAGELLAAKQ